MLKRPIKRLILRAQLLGRPAPRIVVGASGFGQAGWISTDINALNLLREGDWRGLLREGSLAAILAEHVWEHLEPDEGLQAAARCARYLRPGGHLRIAVPDGRHPDPAYREQMRPGGSGVGADDHRVFYSYPTLAALLERAGLRPRPLEYFDEAGAFHAVDWEPAEGMVRRSRRFDRRNVDGRLVYTSLIVDGVRP